MEFQSNHRKEKHLKIQDDDNIDWIEDYILETKRIVKDDAHIYLFFSHHNLEVLLEKVKKHLNYKSILIREKNNT
jgi:site-specific DNA-methyltransferase (adenine-specific)